MDGIKESEDETLTQELEGMVKSYLEEIGELKGAYSSERDLAEYEKVTRLSREEMRGKSILDIGMSVKFLLGALKESLKVVALEGYRGRAIISRLAEHVKFSLAQEMPFPSNSFDLVIANNSVPLHLESGDDFGALLCLYQMLRVCRPNGKVVVCPLPDEPKLQTERVINLHRFNFPRNKKWNIDLISLLDQSHFEYQCLPCGGHNQGEYVYHIQKSFSSDLEPIQKQLIFLGEKRGYA